MSASAKTETTVLKPSTNVLQNGASDSAPSRGEPALLGTIANIATPPPPSRVVWRFYLQSLSRELLPDMRVVECLRKLQPAKPGVLVMHSPQARSGHYKNLIVCARIWVCPVCASKITEQRRRELTLAVEQSEYVPLLITFTLRHHKDDNLKSMVAAIMQAFRKMKQGAAWKRIRESIEWVGDVRALEVTYGDNGWHPHIHVLTLVRVALEPDTLKELENSLKARWQKILKRLGRDASWAHGVDVRTGDKYIAEYITKYGRLPKVTGWTIEHELTKQAVKMGKHEGRSPMQLLADYGAGDKESGELFKEYAEAFFGRHQLQWSRGLRDKLGLNEQAKTDEEIANEDITPASILAVLSRQDWRAVLGNDARAELLDIAGAGDIVALSSFLAKIGVELTEMEFEYE